MCPLFCCAIVRMEFNLQRVMDAMEFTKDEIREGLKRARDSGIPMRDIARDINVDENRLSTFVGKRASMRYDDGMRRLESWLLENNMLQQKALSTQAQKKSSREIVAEELRVLALKFENPSVPINIAKGHLNAIVKEVRSLLPE